MYGQAKNGVSFSQIAKTCYEVNKVYCESIGDFSQPKWEVRSEERRVGKECRSRWSPYH